MAQMVKRCRISGKEYVVREIDLEFYEKMGVPPPTLCPTERDRVRLAFRNDRNLYRRTCSKSGAQIISMFHSHTPFPVYSREVWWGDNWSALEYGREFDFTRPFFEQFQELRQEVPHFPLYQVGNQENTAYTHHSSDNKNCHLCFSVVDCEDCYYADSIDKCKDCVDCTYVNNSELCFGCIDSANCYGAMFLQDCHNTSESAFCRDLRGCAQCICCTNLVQKQYHIFNHPVSKQEFDSVWKEIFSGTVASTTEWQRRFEEFSATNPHKGETQLNCENTHGARIRNCKNVYDCYDTWELEDCAYACRSYQCKDTYDSYGTYKCEQQYFVSSSEICFGGFATYSFRNNFSWYTEQCHYSNYLFGCVGLKKAEYCIFNKQYSKEDYQRLTKKLIGHMTATGEWGEFFPLSLSPFGYNESLAMDYYVLTKAQAKQLGAPWYDDPAEFTKLMADGKDVFAASQLPESIFDVNDSYVNKAVLCAETGRAFKLIPQEITFYKKNSLPLPEIHHDERYRKRLAQRKPRTLAKRSCSKCKKEMQTSLYQESYRVVYCDSCYNHEF